MKYDSDEQRKHYERIAKALERIAIALEPQIIKVEKLEPAKLSERPTEYGGNWL